MNGMDMGQGNAFDEFSALGDMESPAQESLDAPIDPQRMEQILRIPVLMQVVVGSATLPVSSLLKLGRGAIVPLDHRIGDPVDVVVNGRVIKRRGRRRRGGQHALWRFVDRDSRPPAGRIAQLALSTEGWIWRASFRRKPRDP